MADGDVHTDEELARLDLPDLLRRGLVDVAAGPARRALFGDGAVSAAITLDRFDVLPRSLTFLAAIVRAGGVGYAAELAEPLPAPVAAEAVRGWLRVAADAPTDDAAVARWLDAVAVVIDLRRRSRRDDMVTDRHQRP